MSCAQRPDSTATTRARRLRTALVLKPVLPRAPRPPLYGELVIDAFEVLLHGPGSALWLASRGSAAGSRATSAAVRGAPHSSGTTAQPLRIASFGHQQKLLAKVRTGARIPKTCDAPATPYQRVLAGTDTATRTSKARLERKTSP